MKSTIPDEIEALNLPRKNEVIVIGGATMELHGLRKAGDIDMVVSLKNWRYLRDTLGWAVYYKSDGRRYLQDSLRRFDVWRWWFNPNDHSRIHLNELMTSSIQHSVGFHYPTLMYLGELKSQLHRDKDSIDIGTINKHKKY